MNQTIYFRKDVWNKFQDEVGKSNLVNQLLAKHYGINPNEITVDDRPLELNILSIPKKDVNKSVRIVPDIIKTKEDALVSAIKVNNETKGMKLSDLCKVHGTPLDTRGRCLQKGCKYA